MLVKTIVSFPGFGIGNFSVDNEAFSFGDSFAVYWYGIIIVIGIIAAFAYGTYRGKFEGVCFDDCVDIALFTVIAGVIGARLYYVLTSLDEFIPDPFYLGVFIKNVINIRGGGLAIYGGIIGGAIAILAMTKIKKLNFFKMGDIAVMGLLVGQTIGRWGNFVNREAYGGDTNSLFAMKIDTWYHGVSVQEGVTYIDEANRYIQVHPTFLYESMWNLMLFILIMIFRKKKQYNGQVILWYFAGYGIGRTIIEGMRTDQLILFGTGIPVSQALSALLAVGSIIALVYFGIKYKGRESVWGEDLKKIPKEEKNR